MMGKRMSVSAVILTIAAVGQIILTIILYNPKGSVSLINTGWLILWISAFFGWVPIYTFRKKGNISGRSYIHTTTLVDSGAYGIVRHPQYLAGILMSIALFLITLHWAVLILGVIVSGIIYITTYDEEEGCIEKFGDDYLSYQKSVPRINFVLGIIRVIRTKISKRF